MRVLLSTTVDWPSAARLAGAFAASGATVDALFPRGHVLAQSRYVARKRRYYPLAPISSLAAALDACQPDLIVPCDDRAVSHLLAIHARGGVQAKRIERSLGNVASYPDLMSRDRFVAAAQMLGIAAPEMHAVASLAELEHRLQDFGFPAVLKLDGSWGGDGISVVHNREEARAAFERLSRPRSRLRGVARSFLRKDLHFLRDALYGVEKSVITVQRFVAGTPATSAFACRDGKVLAAIHVDVVETMRANGAASVVRRTESAAMDSIAATIAARFGLSGLQGLDYMRDSSGNVHLIEMNPRATQICALSLAPGADLPAALMGTRARPPLRAAADVVALFPQEWRRDPASPWLRTAYLDAPWDDPAVLRALLAPGETPPLPTPPQEAALTVQQAARH